MAVGGPSTPCGRSGSAFASSEGWGDSFILSRPALSLSNGSKETPGLNTAIVALSQLSYTPTNHASANPRTSRSFLSARRPLTCISRLRAADLPSRYSEYAA